MIPLFSTYMSPKAGDAVKAVVDSGWVGQGKKVKEFEDLLSSDFGISHPVALNSCTSALHLALILSGVKEGDEVILPAQTFIATGLAILMCKAKPVFVNSSSYDGTIDTHEIRNAITDKTKAIICVHWGGYPCDLNEINSIAQDHKISVIEDAAHAFGATYMDKPIGSISRFTCFSFQAIKHLSTGDGGVLACKYSQDAQKARQLRWFGIDKDTDLPDETGERVYCLEQVGYKYHMNDIAATIGIENLKVFPQTLERIKQIVNRYKSELPSSYKVFEFLDYKEDRESSYWFFPLFANNQIKFIQYLKDMGIESSIVHKSIHMHPIFGKQHDIDTFFSDHHVALPTHPNLTDQDVDYIIDILIKGSKNGLL